MMEQFKAILANCQNGFELFHYLQYSVDLALSNFHVFQSLRFIYWADI